MSDQYTQRLKHDLATERAKTSRFRVIIVDKQERIAELEAWQAKAFDCYPNIDLDIKALDNETT
jgi:hypothetical protein